MHYEQLAWNGCDSVLTSTCCRIFEGELAKRRNIIVGFPLEFDHGAQVWPKKCTMQRTSN